MRNTFKEDGSYSPESGAADDLAQKPQAELSVNLASISGLADFKPGDEAMLHMKVRIGQASPDGEGGGMTTLEVVRITADPMDSGAKTERMRSATPMAGEGDEGVQDA